MNGKAFSCSLSSLPAYLVLGFLCFFFSASLFGQGNGTRDFLLVIDPGHGGNDPGTTNGKVFEKDIVLSISKRLGRKIEEGMPGVKVMYTRKTDVFIKLHERAAIANRAHADLFISIHADGVKDSQVRGSSVFVMGLHKNEENLEVAKRENAVITKEEDYLSSYDAFDNSTESYIKFSLMQNLFLDQSIMLASKIQQHFNHRVGLKDRGVKQAGFLVLWKSAMPSVLVETGFVTNDEECRFLVSEEGQEFISTAIFEALRDYKNSLDKATYSLKEGSKEKDQAKEQGREVGDLREKTDSAALPGKPSEMGKSMKEPLSTTTEEPQKNREAGGNPSILFAVQMASNPTPIPLRDGRFKSFPGIKEDFRDGAYKYTWGHCKDYDQALKNLSQARKKIPDAFLVAFRDGKKIPVQEARKALKP